MKAILKQARRKLAEVYNRPYPKNTGCIQGNSLQLEPVREMENNYTYNENIIETAFKNMVQIDIRPHQFVK